MRENDQAKRQHPEAQDRQKAQKATADKRRSRHDSTRPGTGNGDFELAEHKATSLLVEPIATFWHSRDSLHFGGSGPLSHRPPDGEPTNKNKTMTFFLKNRLANGASISITPLTPR
jgi:hypothetical protein